MDLSSACSGIPGESRNMALDFEGNTSTILCSEYDTWCLK